MNVREAFARLAEAGQVSLRLDATEWVGTRTTQTQATVRWLNAEAGKRDFAKVEAVVWTNGVMSRRLVLDGLTVWDYDPRTNSYTAQRVDDGRGATAPAGYRKNVLALLTGSAPGPASDALRLARELLGEPAGAAYRTWMPGVRPTGGGSGRETWAVYDLPSGNAMRVTFALDAPDEDDRDQRPLFRGFRRQGTVRGGGSVRTLDATISTVEDDALTPTSPAFVFVPPVRAISVAPTRRAGF